MERQICRSSVQRLFTWIERLRSSRPGACPCLAQAVSAAAILFGSAVMAGWAFGIPALTDPLPGGAPVKPNSAAGCLLSGLSLGILAWHPGRGRERRLALTSAAVVLGIGLLTSCEYLLGQDLGIDQLFFRDPAHPFGISQPGRMPPTTALYFVLVGTILLLMDVPRAARLAELLTLVLGLGGLLEVAAHAFDITLLEGLASYARLAVHTGFSVVVLSMGILCARPRRGAMAVLTSSGPSGLLARRLLPAVLGVPVALGWLGLKGQRAGWFDLHDGFGLMALASMAVLSVLVWWSAVALWHKEAALRRSRRHLLRQVARRRSAEQAALQANRELETLLHVVSHDLKEPLRAIEGFTGLVQRRHAAGTDAHGSELLRRTCDAAAHLRALLESVERLSRARLLEPPAQSVDARSVVRDVLARLEDRIDATGARIEVAPDLPHVRADRTWITEALYNLVCNALKYVRPGHAPDIEIAGFESEDAQEVGLLVRDRGPGVPPEHHERIFGLFQRAVGRDIEGTGAGLAIVRAVAERHGGRAWVRERAGGGSEFVITFAAPTTRPDLPEAA